MGFLELLIIAVGVSMDAFAVSICKGLSVDKIKTKYGNKRICKDGPVLVKEEIIWEK